MTRISGQSDRGARVRRAFLDQAGFCDRLGSSFTGLLCRALADGLDGSSDIERCILEWPGDASPFADSLPLRVAGALHHLVRADRACGLADLYPPNAVPDPATLLATARGALRDQSAFVREFLQSPPQTNEVGRSAAIVAGWLEIAARTRLPLSVFEIGSSAGLNLIADRYAYRFGAVQWAPDSTSDGGPARELHGLTIACEWQGRPPAVDAPLHVRSRRGCDRHPLDMTDPAQRERLLAYVWADQRERLDRLNAAITVMLSQPVIVETSGAADWLDAVLASNAERNVTRVVFHIIVWNYLDRRSQRRIAARMAETGSAAPAGSPLAWLRLELAGKDEPAELRLALWPDGTDELLARVHPHGAWVRWRD